MNLLKETEELLKRQGLKLEDAVWIGSGDGYISLETFKKLADTEYDNGYGAPEVAEDLMIVGKDWYMMRREYDGSEWWEFYSMDLLHKPDNELEVTTLVGGMWDTLKELNGGKKYV